MKINFWDTHSVPENILVVCNKFIADLEDSDVGDRGVFNAGYGEDTMNGVKLITRKVVHKYLGNTTLKRSMLRYPDKLLWVIHKEVGDETWLYKPRLVEKHSCEALYSRGDKAYNVTGLTDESILSECHRDDTYNTHDYRMERTKGVEQKEELKQVLFSEQYDGLPILVLCAAYPKMSYSDIMMVIANEKGTVGVDGIIHRA